MRVSKYDFRNSFRMRTVDRILSSGIKRQLLCLTVLAIVFWAALFGVAKLCGFRSNDMFKETTTDQQVVSEEIPLRWAIYYHFVDSGNLHQTTPESRWFAMLISFLGSIILTGLLISTLSNIIERRIDKYKKGLLRYNFSNHIIIFGCNEITPYLIRQLTNSEKYENLTIVIQTSKSVEEARMKLFSELKYNETNNIIFVYARREMEDELRSLNVDKANEVFILGESYLENKAEYAHDSLNMDCLSLIGKICLEKRCSKKLKCNILFEYQTTFSAFQFSDLSKNLKSVIDFYPFNFYENWAQKVFVAGKTSNGKVKYQPLDRELIDVNSEKRVHLVVVGMSKMGVALAIEAAHTAHYPNFKSRGIKTKITFIDLNVEEEMNFVKSHYKNLFDLSYSKYTDLSDPSKSVEFTPSKEYSHLGSDFIDIEWEFVKGNVADPKIQNAIKEWAEEKNDLLTIAVCFNFPHTSISCAIYLPDSVYVNNIPVLVLQRDSSAVINNISGLALKDRDQKGMYYKNLRPFGMESDCFDLKTSDLILAKRVKYVYSFFYDRDVDPVQLPSSEELEKLWYNSESVAKMWSNIYNANSIPTKLRSIGYPEDRWGELYSLTQEQIDVLSEVEHNRWNVEKLLLGFRPPNNIENGIITANVNEEKDNHKKRYIHYDIRSYDMLQDDSTGRNAKEYDICLTKALPLIINA